MNEFMLSLIFFRKNNVMKFDDDIKFQLHAFRENKENEIQ